MAKKPAARSSDDGDVEKSADAFRTISEVASELDVQKHVLRFWEARFKQIKPMKRGGGRRFYRPEDVDLIKGIQHLLHSEGFTIRGVQKILRRQGAEVVKACWHKGAPPLTSPDRAGAAPAPAADRPARAGARRAAKAMSDADRMKLVRGIVAELEACRRLLTEAPA